MNEAERCDRISLMHAGKVLASDTPQAHPRCLQRGLNDPFPFFLHQILGELDDQDRILGRQTDRGQELSLIHI